MSNKTAIGDDAGGDSVASLDLSTFFPYRLSILQLAVSNALAALYSDRFNLNRNQWRTMAALGDRGSMSASEIAAHTNMDKVQISRAIAAMQRAGLVTRKRDVKDRRRLRVDLSADGHQVYGEIVPLVRARSDQIRAVLSAKEAQEFDRLMIKMRARAESILSARS